MLASRFQDIAQEIPSKLKGLPDEPKSSRAVVIDWILFYLNIVSGALYGVFNMVFLLYLLNNGDVSSTWATLRVLAVWVVIGCAIISGVILVRSLQQIRDFFAARDATGFISIPMLFRYGMAFGIFLAFTIISAIGAILNELGPQFLGFFRFTLVANTIAQFVTQLFLVEIFWTLGTNVPSEPIEGDPDGADFQRELDQETQNLDVSSRIWNGFLRTARGASLVEI